MPDATRSRSRLSRAARREQLLDAAARLLVEQGENAVTMERVAEWAGVSKALPYSHFDNSDDVLVALYAKSVGELGRRIVVGDAGTHRQGVGHGNKIAGRLLN